MVCVWLGAGMGAAPSRLMIATTSPPISLVHPSPEIRRTLGYGPLSAQRSRPVPYGRIPAQRGRLPISNSPHERKNQHVLTSLAAVHVGRA